MHARLARETEAKSAETINDNDKVSHFGFVTASIMQSTAALECEIWEVMEHRSKGQIHRKKTYEEKGQNNSLLYQKVLQLLNKAPLDETSQYWKDASVVVSLRNRLVHYDRYGANNLRVKSSSSPLRVGFSKNLILSKRVPIFSPTDASALT
jgi:hypothetical protein